MFSLMSPIQLPPDHVSLFAPAKKKAKRRKPEKPLPWWVELALLLYASAIALSFGYVGAQFGLIAAFHMSSPHATGGLVLGFVLSTVALVAFAVVGKTSTSLLGMT